MSDDPTAVRRYHSHPRPGKIEIRATKPCLTQDDLSLAYTPGVAVPCLDIRDDPEKAWEYTARGNLVAVITNGTAVLGLGNIGALAGKPVMEGKAVLFKRFADIDAVDLELDTTDPEAFIAAVRLLEPSFGGINLEDIRSPECFKIERRLQEAMRIPVFHDDQHGTAIVAGAALLNGLELVGKSPAEARVVFSGAGAAGVSCANLFLELGIRRDRLIMCDQHGVVFRGRCGLDPWKGALAADTTIRTLTEALDGADVFVGLSIGNILTGEMLQRMAPRPLIFALANPTPEISFEAARAARPDAIVATGRSDCPNQVNNVLGFPFIFRGALDTRSRAVDIGMKLAASRALAELARRPVPEQVLRAYGGRALSFGPEYLLPKPFDPRLPETVALAVALAAGASGLARKPIADPDEYVRTLRARIGNQEES